EALDAFKTDLLAGFPYEKELSGLHPRSQGLRRVPKTICRRKGGNLSEFGGFRNDSNIRRCPFSVIQF
ncbi:hypothetical protein, partial [Klebsiella pneumoniae]|uniref:hypothetical protein n=1 Tax=Klebsiella pneumoniae TaxID=573 RepID=UPI00405557E5